MPPISARQRFVVILVVILAGLLLSVWLAGRTAERRQWSERSVEAQGQLELYAQSLRILVERFRAVPAIVAHDSEVLAALRAGADPLLRQQLNHRLQRLNGEAGSAVLYLLDVRGETIAASNWQEPGSFVGNHYDFRPYFRDAMRQGSGRYFAVGVTTGVPGYFLSRVVRDLDGRTLGVVVLKLEMEELQRDWAGQPGILLVTDPYGIAILASRPAWRFRYLPGLSAAQRDELLAARKYAEQTLQPLGLQALRSLDEGGELQRVDGPDGRRDYLWQRRGLSEEGWTLHLLHEAHAPDGAVRSYRLAAGGAWLALAFLLLFLVQRQKNRRLRQRSRAELERLVDERTAELRQAQDELVQAAKMAALGQMSAALAHEINQPLTAKRMKLGSLGLLLAKNDFGGLQVAALATTRNLVAALFGLENSRSPEDLGRVLDVLRDWLGTPASSELRRAFTVWLRRVLLPRRVPNVNLPELRDLGEVQAMIAENEIDWTRTWREEGMREGMHLGQAAVLTRLLERKFGPLPEEHHQRVTAADNERLLEWADRVLDARRIEDVFGQPQ